VGGATQTSAVFGWVVGRVVFWPEFRVSRGEGHSTVAKYNISVGDLNGESSGGGRGVVWQGG
jgi:hypothetical protein